MTKNAKKLKNLGLFFNTEKKTQNVPKRPKKRSQNVQKVPKIATTKKCKKINNNKSCKTYNNKKVPKSAKRCQKVPKKGHFWTKNMSKVGKT